MQQQQLNQPPSAANVRFTDPPTSTVAAAAATTRASDERNAAALSPFAPQTPNYMQPSSKNTLLSDNNAYSPSTQQFLSFLNKMPSPESASTGSKSQRRGIELVEDPKAKQLPAKQPRKVDAFAAAALLPTTKTASVPNLVSIPVSGGPQSNLKDPPPSSSKPPAHPDQMDERKPPAVVFPDIVFTGSGSDSSLQRRKSSRVIHKRAPMNIASSSAASYDKRQGLQHVETVVSDESGSGSVSTSATLKKMMGTRKVADS